MANQWLRLWHDMPNDPKWRTVAKVAGQPITSVISVYVHLLVSASANATERGRTQLNHEDIASALDIEIAAVEAILAAMQGRVLDGDKLSGWSERQPSREDGSAERSKAWREAKKAEQEGERNRTQTNDQERKRTQDKEEDKDKEKKKKYTTDDLTVAEFIWGKVLIICPKAKQPDIESWANSIRLMREIDHRTHDEMRSVFTWANRHHFWSTNILSPPTLREKFDKLALQMNTGNQDGHTGQSGESANRKRPSLVDTVEQNIARERAERAAAVAGADSGTVAPNDSTLRPQVGEPVRGSDRPGERVGCVLEGTYERAS